MWERKNFISYLLKLKRKNFIFYLQLERKLKVGSPPPDSEKDETKSGISTPRIGKVQTALTFIGFVI